jgi:hypothetical protein
MIRRYKVDGSVDTAREAVAAGEAAEAAEAAVAEAEEARSREWDAQDERYPMTDSDSEELSAEELAVKLRRLRALSNPPLQ